MKFLTSLLLLFLPQVITTAAPLAYSGKVAVNGVNLDGVAQFKFALVDHNGSLLWNHSDEGNNSIAVNVSQGIYSVLLGEAMNPIPNALFLDHPVVYLQVHLNLGDANFLHLQPDQRIVSAAHSLSAGIAESAKVADAVKPGSVTREHLAPGLSADLNATISRSRLSADVLSDLNRTIHRADLASDVLADLNRTIDRSNLSVEVLADLNRTITREMLPSDVLADINASVTISRLHPDLVKYFLPEISNHPSTTSLLKGTGATLSSSASGKFLSYQWQKDGSNLLGETNATLVLTDVNGSRSGQYRMVVSNDWGSVTSNDATFTVATNAPSITLEGNASVTHEAATTYVDPGATAVDGLNGNLTASIVVTGSVDENQTGQNQIKYNVSDAGANAALEKVRTVTVVDTTAPVITLVGDANVSHGLNTAWNDPGATAVDTLDGNLSNEVTVGGTVDVNQTGVHVLTYSVADASGNAAATVSRMVNVASIPSGPWVFTNAGGANGIGPSQVQVDAAYSGTSLGGKVTIDVLGVQKWTVPTSGTYLLQAWGAQGGGGSASIPPGKGGFASGQVSLAQNDIIYVCVGGQGSSALNQAIAKGGWNGGGNGRGGWPGNSSSGRGNAGGGGGSSDIRKDGMALTNRILVAGGGGGADSFTSTRVGGAGGGLIGGDGSGSVKGGTQTAGGTGQNSGALGLGGDASHDENSGHGNGGGGGYFGGGGGTHQSGGGGSSFFGGVSQGNTVSGNASMPDPDGGSMVGRQGHGIVIITLLSN